jgi:CBS domain-containing protein
LININEKEAEAILINKIMTPLPLVIANSYDSIFMISSLMKERKLSSIIISHQDNQNYPVGIIERDIVRRVISNNKDPTHTKATVIMSKPLITFETNTYLYDVSVKMVKNKIRRLPIVKWNTLSRIIHITDIIKYFYEKIKIFNYFFQAIIDMLRTRKNNIINLIKNNLF